MSQLEVPASFEYLRSGVYGHYKIIIIYLGGGGGDRL